ncbi:MAG: rRNA pseudouridine synthase [Chloroflexi bacterium]|nr:rRNA pseudouridine synthase [Chloroflexota bacterium]
MTDEGERLQKVLAHAGLCARRECEDWIVAGRVAVNGQVVTKLGTRVGLDDAIAVDSRPVERAAPIVVIAVNKPVGYVSTVRDPQGRPTVVDLVSAPVRVYPVGRLDADSEGLLLLTNDGELTHRLTHPRYEQDKEYRVLVVGEVTPAKLRRLSEGIELDGKRTAPARFVVEGHADDQTWLRVTLREGRKRQIRRMCHSVGLAVQRLIRLRIGPIKLGRLASGKSRPLRPDELRHLREAVGLSVVV